MRRSFVIGLILLAGVAVRAPAQSAAPAVGDSPAPPRDLTPRSGQNPAVTVEQLRRVEARVADLLPKLVAATVGVARDVGGQGSGVIVSEDGLVLTAGHVSGVPDQELAIILSDGRRVRAKTLGRNRSDDSGMIQILDDGPFPFVERGDSASLDRGDWVIATGHPGGWRRDRPAVLRLGRVYRVQQYITSDAVLVGGDSGGPLFDLDGKVVGIHSRIGNSTASNMHVPISRFTSVWDRLVAGEDWSDQREQLAQATVPPVWLGLHLEASDDESGLRVTQVEQAGPAAAAGVMAGDIIARVNGRDMSSTEQIRDILRRSRIGDVVRLEVLRDGGEVATVSVRLARRPAN